MNTRTSQSGVIIVPFIIAMITIVTLLGMLTESSLILHARHKLTNGAESAVFDAANLWNTNNYTQTQLNDLIKSTYSTNNFLVGSNTSLDFGQITSGILSLTTSKSVNTLFLGHSLTLQSTVAVTVPQPVSGTGGAAPLAIKTGDFIVGNTYTLKADGGNSYAPGNFGALELDGSGAKDYEAILKEGYSGTVSLNSQVDVKTGNMSQPTDRAIDYRLDKTPPDDIIIVIVTDAFPNGSGQITVRGFAAFKLTGSDHGQVTGTFIKYKVAATGSSSAPNYGLYTKPKLLYY